MYKKYIPYATAKSVYDIDLNFFIKENVKTLVLDLDNTLDSYKLYHPQDKAKKLIEDIIAKGINPIIISNNKGKRVSSYANDLNVPYINSAMKPFACKINKFVKNNKLNKDEMMLVGDQMITDVKAAYRAKIRIILTEKLVKEDQWTTRFNRIFGEPIRKYHKKRNNLIDWRERYGKN